MISSKMYQKNGKDNEYGGVIKCWKITVSWKKFSFSDDVVGFDIISRSRKKMFSLVLRYSFQEAKYNFPMDE